MRILILTLLINLTFSILAPFTFAIECQALQKTFHELDYSNQQVITQELKSLCSESIHSCSDENLRLLIEKYKDVKLHAFSQPRYEYENSRSIQGDINSPGVYWYKGAERDSFRIEKFMQNGKLNSQFENKRGIFVLDYKGDLYVHFEPRAGKIHHSSIGGGLPVQSAGEFLIKNGKIEEIANRSGHYRPSEESLKKVFDKIKKMGLIENNEKYEITTYMGMESIWNLK